MINSLIFLLLGVMEFSSAGSVGEVQIRGIETNLYLAMDKKGRLYGEVSIYLSR